jgi:hypothetical protein
MGTVSITFRTLSGLRNVYMLPYAPKETVAATRHLVLLGWIVKAHVHGDEKHKQ